MNKTRQTEIDKLYSEAVRLALLEVEDQARVILRKRKNLGEFVMCMGSWFFTDKKGRVIDGDYPWAESLYTLMGEWDEYLKLTGTPMRFTADGPIVRDW